MKRLLGILAMIHLAVMVTSATTVTATVKDANNNLYINCNGSANFIGQNTTPGAGPYLVGGVSTFQTVVPINCNSSAQFTTSLTDNNQISPTPSQWNFSICAPKDLSPNGSGPQICFNLLITITGTSQDVSVALQNAAALLPSTGGGGGSSFPPAAPTTAVFPAGVNILNGLLSTQNIVSTGSNTAVNFVLTGFPEIGLFPDPTCADMVQLGQSWTCWLLDPNTGNPVLVGNDGTNTYPNRQFVNYCTLPSFQTQGQGLAWDATNNCMAFGETIVGTFSGTVTGNPKTGLTAHTVLINQNTSASTAAGPGTLNMLFTSQGASADPIYTSLVDRSSTLYAVGAGTAQAQTVTLSPPATALVAGMIVNYLPGVANTNPAPTLAVNGLTAKNVTKFGTTPINIGDLCTTEIANLYYDGTQFELMNPCNGYIPTTNAGQVIVGNGATLQSFTGFLATANTVTVPGGTACSTVALQGANATGITYGWVFPTGGSTTWCNNGVLHATLGAAGVEVSNSDCFDFSTTSSGNGTVGFGLGVKGAGTLGVFSGNSGCSDGLGLWVSGMTKPQITSDATTTSTGSPGTVFQSWALKAVAANFAFHCSIVYQSSVNTAGITLGLLDSANPTYEAANAVIYSTLTGTQTTAFNSAAAPGTNTAVTILAGANAAAATTNYTATLDGTIEATGTASTFSVNFWATSAATITIKRGSYCALTP